jgi:hypothetical protein
MCMLRVWSLRSLLRWYGLRLSPAVGLTWPAGVCSSLLCNGSIVGNGECWTSWSDTEVQIKIYQVVSIAPVSLGVIPWISSS